MVNKEGTQETDKNASDRSTAGKSIFAINVLTAVFGVLGFACLGIGYIEKGIAGNVVETLAIGIVNASLGALWIIGLFLICINRKKKDPGFIYHMGILLLDALIFSYLLYGRSVDSFEVSIFNLAVCAISVIFALTSLILYCLKSPKIAVQYASYLLLLFSATFAILNYYTLHLIPNLTALRNLAEDASFLDRLIAALMVGGSVLSIIHAILLIGALAGGLVDRGNRLAVFMNDARKEETFTHPRRIFRTRGVIIVKSQEEEEENQSIPDKTKDG